MRDDVGLDGREGWDIRKGGGRYFNFNPSYNIENDSQSKITQERKNT